MIINQDCQNDSNINKRIKKQQQVNETNKVEIQQADEQQQQGVQEQKELLQQEKDQIQNELSQQEDKQQEVAEQQKEYPQKEEKLRTFNLQQLEKQPKQNNTMNAANFSDKSFNDLILCEPTKKALEKMNFTKMTNIQARTIPHLLKGRDVLGVANTGSGKTLGFLVSGLELLYKNKFTQKNGTGIIIITPTRELAQEIFDVAKDLLFYHENTLGLLTGSTDKKEEAIKLQEGVNVLIATPDRLLDHLQNTKEFIYHNLLCLIIDEADQLLKIGYEVEINEILKLLPRERQTLLFSINTTKKVDDLASLSLNQPIYIGNDDNNSSASASDLEQGYMIVEPDRKFLLLFTFLQLNSDKKIMVFMSSSNSVKFHAELLYLVDMPVLDIHGKQKQSIRTSTYYEFYNAEKGVLICTEVAVKGLDIPKVHWILQYDPPYDTKEYIHRIERTNKRLKSQRKSLIFLQPEEKEYLAHLQLAKVSIGEFEFPAEKLLKIQEQFEKIVEKNYLLNQDGFEAYRQQLLLQQSQSKKDVQEANKQELTHLNLNVIPEFLQILRLLVQQQENKKFKLL